MKNIVFDFYRVIYLPEQGTLDSNVLAIISLLKKRNIPLFLFTNTREEVVLEIDKENSFLKYFTKVIYNTEYPKPHTKSFEKLIDTIDSEPSDIVLIDDNSQNISVAKQFGIITIQYKNPKDLDIKLNNILKNDK